jgi:2-(1,2-epoxy-1,2-dihydrophenyl)acetyl-CoA isomerase
MTTVRPIGLPLRGLTSCRVRRAPRYNVNKPSTQETVMTTDLLESHASGITTLTMNRPEARNALTRDMMAALSEALPRLANDPAVRLVVLTGTGAAFCSGGDVKGFARNAAGAAVTMSFDQKVTDLRMRMDVSRWLHEMPKPTLAVIPGPAAGAGLSLALACDLRIAADDAKFTTAFSKIGLSGDFGGSYFLNHLVGAAKAREMYFTGQVLRGDEALRIGLVNRAVPAAQLADAAAAWAAELAALPTVAVGYMKRNLNSGLRSSLSEVLDAEAIHMIRTFETDDHKGAAVAFVEKRPPSFQGR